MREPRQPSRVVDRCAVRIASPRQIGPMKSGIARAGSKESESAEAAQKPRQCVNELGEQGPQKQPDLCVHGVPAGLRAA